MLSTSNLSQLFLKSSRGQMPQIDQFIQAILSYCMNISVWKNTVSISLLFKGGDGDVSPAGASGEASAEQLAEGTESFLQ